MEELKLTRDKAIAFLKASRNRKIFIHAHNLFTLQTDDNSGYELGCALEVKCPLAVNYLQSSISDNMAEKVWVKLNVSDVCIFIS